MAGPKTKISRLNSNVFIYLQCYFVTIATVLGVGILGLPVTLSKAGLYPFLVSFILGFIAQALLIYFFVELLQLAYAALNSGFPPKEEMVPLNDMLDDESVDEFEAMDSTTGPVLAGHVIMPKSQDVESPSLYTLGSLFLGCGFKQCFEIILFMQFVGFLISYALAGSEAYAQIIGVDYIYVIPVFVWTLTFAIVFALNLVQPVVSVLTFFKGCLLLGTVIITFVVGSEVHREIQNNFSEGGPSFLMGTVAIGGVINSMPLMYTKLKQQENQVKNFRLSVILGLFTCMLLNILWCWAVLDIVPQTPTFPCKTGHCYSNISLLRSESLGEISTIPLTEIIHLLYPEYTWVSLLVQSFIVVSITVSFLVSGAILHHTLTGWMKSLWSKEKQSTYKSKEKCCNSQCICTRVVSLFLFSVVFVVAMLDPKGFVEMLEKYSSLLLNLEAGLFVFIMMVKARRKYTLQQKIPVRIPRFMRPLQWIIPLYFGFAVVFDLYNTIGDIINESSPQGLSVNSTHHNRTSIPQLTSLPTTTNTPFVNVTNMITILSSTVTPTADNNTPVFNTTHLTNVV